MLSRDRCVWPAGACAFGIVLLVSAGAQALDPNRGIGQYSHRVWRVEDGLPREAVQALAQDRDGFIWVGTPGGLARFDGVTFRTFDRRNTPAMLSDRIHALRATRDGSVWISTNAGLLRHRLGQFESYWGKGGLPRKSVTALDEDSNGVLWVATDGSLFTFTDGHFRRDSEQSSVRSLFAGTDGVLWVGTDSGLVKRHGDRRTRYTKADGLFDDRVTTLAQDRQGALWIGTVLAALSRLKDGKITTYSPRTEQPDNSVRDLQVDSDAGVWMATMDGIARVRDGVFETFDTTLGLSDNRSNVLLEDSEKNLWVGTASGLECFRDGVFTTYTKREGLSHDWTTTVAESRDGSLWVATRGGGFHNFKNGHFRGYSRRDGLVSDYVRIVFEDTDGSVWAGTNQGLSRLRDGKFTTFTKQDGLPSNDVVTLVPARQGGFWIGAQGGVGRFSSAGFSIRATIPELTYARPVYEDSKMRLWYGVAGHGLNVLNGDSNTHYTVDDGLGSNGVKAIHEDGQGTLWVGTTEGLSRFRDGHWSTVTTRQGLFDDDISQVVEDEQGRLWLGGPKAVFHVDKKAVEQVMAGKQQTVVSTFYGKGDGLRSQECSVDQPGRCLTRDGRLWLTGPFGLMGVDTRSLPVHQTPPPVFIENLVINGRPQENGLSTTVPPGPRNLEITYTALCFREPKKIRFKYRLEGFDTDWVDADRRRTATYTNLPPGPYHFRVIACNESGVWNESGASADVVFASFWHETSAFYPAVFLVILLLATLLYRLRLMQVKARFSAVFVERNRMARELHDTLDQAFTAVTLQLDVAEKSLPTAALAHRPLGLARDLLLHSQAEARRSIADLRSQALDGGNLAEAMSSAIQTLTAGLDLQANLRVVGQPRSLPGTVQNDLLRISQEAVANALRHAQATRIDLCLSYEPDLLRLTIKDDGRGFDMNHAPSERDGHFGLVGMRERAKQLGGHLTVLSAPGQGTHIDVQLRI